MKQTETGFVLLKLEQVASDAVASEKMKRSVLLCHVI